jgi:hypothetical protein
MNVVTTSTERSDKSHIAPSRSRSTAADPIPSGVGAAFGLPDIQQGAGNLAIQRMLNSGHIQAKLSISQPNDPDEQEADRVADQVMRMTEPAAPTLSKVALNDAPLQRKCAECATGAPCPKCDDEQKIQTKELPSQKPQITAKFESSLASLHSGGQPLPPSVRNFFEPRFGADFSQVRVHSDGQAAESARAIQARAFTVGRDVVFGAGEYGTEMSEGQRLLAHELAHVVQQNRLEQLASRVAPFRQRTQDSLPPAIDLVTLASAPAIRRAPGDAPAAMPGNISTNKSAASSLETIATDLQFDLKNKAGRREQILRNMLRAEKQSAELKRLYKEKSPNKDADLIADLKPAVVSPGWSTGDFIRAQRYLDYGELRTVDKIYLAAKGAGTDWPTIERLLPEVNKNFTAVEAAFSLDYKDDYPKKARLPNGQQSGIGGLMDDEFPSGNDAPEVIKGKAVIAFGEPQPLDLVRAATDGDTMLRPLQQARGAFESVEILQKRYQERYPESLLQKHIESKLSGDDIKRARMILDGTYTARNRIKLAMGAGIDPDEKQIWAAFQEATPAELEELRREYKNHGEIYKMFKGGIFTGLSKENLMRAEAMLGAGPEGEEPILTKLKAQGGVTGADIVKVIKTAVKGDWAAYRDAYNIGNGPLRKFADELLSSSEKGQLASYLQDKFLDRFKYVLDRQDVEYVTLQIISFASEDDKKSILGDSALVGTIGSNFSAREANKIRDLLIPANLNPEEKAKLLGQQISRESSFVWSGTANAEALEDEQRELAIALEKAKTDGKLTTEEQNRLNELNKRTESALSAYIGARDELNGYLETALNIAASIAVTAVTGGAGAGLLAAAVARAALAQAVVSVVVKKIVHGDNFEVLSPEGTGVFLAGFVDGAMNAVGGPAAKSAISAALRDSARLSALETGNVVFASSGRTILTHMAGGVIGSSPGAMVGTAVDDGTWKDGFEKGFGRILQSGAQAGVAGGAMSLGAGVIQAADLEGAKKGFTKLIKGLPDGAGIGSHELGITSLGIRRCSDAPACMILADSLKVRANKLNQVPADADVNWFQKWREYEKRVKELYDGAEDINLRTKESFKLPEPERSIEQAKLLREAEKIELEMTGIEHQFYGVSGKQPPAGHKGKWGIDGKGTPGEGPWYPDPDHPAYGYTKGQPIMYDAKFPNLTPWSMAEVPISMKGQEIDFEMADTLGAAWAYHKNPNTFGTNGLPDVEKFKKFREDYRLAWHHKENGVTMQLVPIDLHSRIPHLGGSSLSRGVPVPAK